jgi:tetratricopeptide (TPR) repeat protein
MRLASMDQHASRNYCQARGEATRVENNTKVYRIEEENATTSSLHPLPSSRWTGVRLPVTILWNITWKTARPRRTVIGKHRRFGDSVEGRTDRLSVGLHGEKEYIFPLGASGSAHTSTQNPQSALVQPRQRRLRHGKTSPALATARRRAFLAFTFAFPFLFFILVETVLRVTGYGPDISLFVTEEIGGRTYHIMNPLVKARYFARVDFSPTTSLDYFPVPKLPGTFRIFCLGGSTTVGFPYGYAGSFPTLLRDRLQHIFPDRRIEVINLGMTATNSFTVADIAEELPRYEPDLLVVYDGHNEFYGALGVASRESFGRSRWVTRTYLKAIHLKTFQALRDLYNLLRGTIAGNASDPGGTLMERLAKGQYIEYGSAPYAAALEIFRENVRDLAAVASRHAIPVLLGTQVSNLRDLPPFISEHPSGLPPERRLAFAQAMKTGLTHRADNEPEAAARAFREAISIDSMRADAHYELARSLGLLGRKGEAYGAYVRARDLDRLRFRASSDFNNVITQASQLPGVRSADMERAFREESPDSLIGNSLMLEHLHPNLRGYFLLAREYAREMRALNLLATASEWASRDTVDEAMLWKNEKLTELDARAADVRIERLTSGWPFHERPGPPRHAPLPAGIDAIAMRLTSGASTWEEAHVAAAQFYQQHNDIASAEKEYRTLISILPVNVSAYLLLAQLYITAGRIPDAYAILQSSVSVEGSLFAYRILGSLEARAGRFDRAIPYLERAVSFCTTNDERSDNRYVLAAALKEAGMKDRAIIELRGVLETDPHFRPAIELLARLGQH